MKINRALACLPWRRIRVRSSARKGGDARGRPRLFVDSGTLRSSFPRMHPRESPRNENARREQAISRCGRTDKIHSRDELLISRGDSRKIFNPPARRWNLVVETSPREVHIHGVAFGSSELGNATFWSSCLNKSIASVFTSDTFFRRIVRFRLAPRHRRLREKRIENTSGSDIRGTNRLRATLRQKRGNKSGVTMSGRQDGVESRSGEAEKVAEQYARVVRGLRFFKACVRGWRGTAASRPIARN